MKRLLLTTLAALAVAALLPSLAQGQDREEQARAQAVARQVQAQRVLVRQRAAEGAVQADLVVADVVEEAVEGVETAPDDAADADENVGPTPMPRPAVEELPPGTLRFHLMDGSIVTGKLQAENLPIKTEFGELIVPITSIQSFSPGLASHPELDQRIQSLVQLLGSPDAEQRDMAQAELTGFGVGIVPELQRHTDDPDAERKVRIVTIIDELYYNQEDNFMQVDNGPQTSLVQMDTVVTEGFTIAGSIEQQTFNIQSKFGMLVVQLADIKQAERITQHQAQEIRRSLDILGTDVAGMSYKNTGIRLNRGDRVLINAGGNITLTPWGSRTVSGPDGWPQSGMYSGNIPMGALAGRVGDSGEEFLVGSKNSFVAQRAGTLYLGFAMQANYAGNQFPGKYEARIRVVPAE